MTHRRYPHLKLKPASGVVPEPQTNAPVLPSSWRGRSLWLGLVFLFWITLISLPDYAYGVGLDDSWEQGLAHLWNHRAQAGIDYIFTVGPLGYFYSRAYDPSLYWPKYAWELSIKLAMALVFAHVAFRMPKTARWPFAISVIVLLGPANRSMRDALFSLFLFSLAIQVCASARSRWLLVVDTFILALLSLVKFNFFLLACLYVPLTMVFFVAEKRVAQAALVLGSFSLWFLLLWLATGQALGHLPQFLHGSWQITAGFSEGMSLPGPIEQVILAAIVTAMLLATVVTLDRRPLTRVQAAVLGLLLAGTFFLQWKQGFTRQDGPHVAAFFAFLALLPFVFLAYFRPERRTRLLHYGAAAGTVLLAVFCIDLVLKDKGGIMALARTQAAEWPRRVMDAACPWRLPARLQNEKLPYEDICQLPRIQTRVGDAPIDLLSYNQGLLFLNHLHWQPRPVFQGYSAYTPDLLEANAEFLRSDKAPTYIMMTLPPLDHRLPSTDDGRALLEIFQRYQPSLVEKGLVLLERRDRDGSLAKDPEQILAQKTIHFEEPFSLANFAGEFQILSLKFRYTVTGWLRAFFYQPTPLLIKISTTDGHEFSFRLVPALASSGFLINPLLQENADILRVYGMPGALRVKSFVVSSWDSGPGSYKDAIELTLRACPHLIRRKLSQEEFSRLLEH
jgi:hypothetical protein